MGEFAGYDEVLPGAADRILRMAEKDQDSQIGIGRRESRAEALSFTFASVMVSGLPVALVMLTVVLAILGHDTAAILSGIMGFTAAGPQIITAIRSTRRKERDPE